VIKDGHRISEPSSRKNNSNKMKTNIQIFTNEVFGEIRTITNGSGETFFVGKDVATALGYSNTRDALNRHVDAEDKGTVAIRDTAYETRVTLISESGLYARSLLGMTPSASRLLSIVNSQLSILNYQLVRQDSYLFLKFFTVASVV
jgi:prophage antirepressor-like protein